MRHKFDKIIRGEFITLKKVTIADAPYIYTWRTSSAGQYLNSPPDYSVTSQINWIESRDDKQEMNYIIYARNTNIRVGMIGIYEVSWADLVSNCGRLILDEQFVHKSTPYGLEALSLGYGYVFNNMGFRKISGIINSKNKRIYELQKYLGMVDEGYFKAHIMLNGEPQDMYFLSLFKEDFPQYAIRLNLLLNKFRT